MLAEYANQIAQHLKETERCPNFGYMEIQDEVNERMRAILIDWLFDVHLKFKLLPETLFLTFDYIDLFLEKFKATRENL